MTIPAPVSQAQAATAVWTCQRCGEGLEGACGAPSGVNGCRLDAELVVARLEAAGATLLAMRGRSPFPREPSCAWPDTVQAVIEAYGYTPAECRPSVPDAQAISRMDATWQWLSLIPSNRHVLRRIVASRSLVHPTTGKHVIHWRRLGVLLRLDYRAAQRWHHQGIELIVTALGNGC